jgi:hypothetical protein
VRAADLQSALVEDLEVIDQRPLRRKFRLGAAVTQLGRQRLPLALLPLARRDGVTEAGLLDLRLRPDRADTLSPSRFAAPTAGSGSPFLRWLSMNASTSPKVQMWPCGRRTRTDTVTGDFTSE